MNAATAPIPAGFADPVFGAQRAFRAALAAMAHPARIVELEVDIAAPPGLHPATAALLLALADYETPIWFDRAGDEVRRFLRFHAGAPIVERPADARFVAILDPTALAGLDRFDIGDDEEPERGATLIVQARRLVAGFGTRLAGPGIVTELRLQVDGPTDSFWAERRQMQARAPRGLDMFFAVGREIVGLPRSTEIRS